MITLIISIFLIAGLGWLFFTNEGSQRLFGTLACALLGLLSVAVFAIMFAPIAYPVELFFGEYVGAVMSLLLFATCAVMIYCDVRAAGRTKAGAKRKD